ncbi:MAG: NAD(P)/FAD-dependent oxidoreductase [Phycisphaerae bacterium]|nr:NAD(P)/FAD-dependent oxidoreductase [Phycisphaerae bacterium]
MIQTDICIIGAGPAGLAATIGAKAKKVTLVEANTTAGRKLLLTGRGRCNLTHIGSIDEVIRAYKPFDRFVRHCIHEFPPQKLRDFFSHRGLETVADNNGCVFPKTDRSSDVKESLLAELKKNNIKTYYGKKINSVKKCDDLFIIESEKITISAKCLIIATGGVSWPQTGSTGDGYEFAKSLGHNIIEPKPCLIPLVTKEKFCSSLAGIGVQAVQITGKIDGKKISSSGPMIFTHSGVGGPAVLDFSRLIAETLDKTKIRLDISVDFLPDLKNDELDEKLAETFSKSPKQSASTVLSDFLPKALARQICEQNRLTKTIAEQINKKTRKTLVENLKNFPFTILSAEAIEKATVTRGGIDIGQIEAKTMQSKLCPGLFFAGEVINIDGPCGGYNLQFAFAAGALAGKSAVEFLNKIA